MSKQDVIKFISYIENQVETSDRILEDPDPDAVILHAGKLGFSFNEEELKSVLNTRICNAESLPRPWGWVLARKFGLVRS